VPAVHPLLPETNPASSLKTLAHRSWGACRFAHNAGMSESLPPLPLRLIIVGDEILSGKRQDKHLSKIIELLAARGMSLSGARYVGDVRSDITEALREAFAWAQACGGVVFSTGGIGATPDDHTRQCAAAALGLELALHAQAKAKILERMQDMALENGHAFEPDRPDNQHRLNMGVFPVGAAIVPNPYNKIAGFYCHAAGPAPAQGGPGCVYFVPGFPVMAWPMIEWVLDTHLAAWHRDTAQQERSFIVTGAMEATLTPLMEAIERDFVGVKVFSLPSVDHPQYGRHIELGVKAVAAEIVQAAYDALKMGVLDLGGVIQTELAPKQ
jgi:molybdopterin-biosynthesis enzyme MoeA-like protein